MLPQAIPLLLHQLHVWRNRLPAVPLTLDCRAAAMAGMLFVVCVPTAEKEYEMVNGLPPPPGRGPLVNLDGPAVARVDPLQSRGPGTRKINPDTVPMERVSEWMNGFAPIRTLP